MNKEYIDKSAFLKNERVLYCKNCARRFGTKNGKLKEIYQIGDAPCNSCELNDALDSLDDFPAADVEPVRHGHWMTKEPLPRTYGRPRAMCCRCGSFALYEFVNVQSYKEILTKYCPNCGAKMDGKENK